MTDWKGNQMQIVLASVLPVLFKALIGAAGAGVALKALFPKLKLTQTKARIEEEGQASVGASAAARR